MADVRGIEETKQNIPISINALVREFNCSRSSLKLALARRLEIEESM
jgi:hypothetical protein